MKEDEAKQKTILEVLHQNAKQKPNHVLLRWLDTSCRVTDSLTYSQLWSQSAAVRDKLVENGVKPGDRVMISYPFGLSFLAGFFGCMKAGVIPCSVYPPNPMRGKAEYSYEQFNTQVSDAGAEFALTTSDFKKLMERAASWLGCKANVTWIPTDNLKPNKNHRPDDMEQEGLPVHSLQDMAFIQYSSGSISEPKGIMISHGALVACLNWINLDLGGRAASGCGCGVSWLPQYHDYGLIVVFLGSVYSPTLPFVTFSPIDFIRNPLLWADALDKFKGTHTHGPNFAYSLLAKRMNACGRKVNRELRLAFLGAEPIAPETLDAMKEIGISSEAIAVGYGMAECVVCVTSIEGHEIRVEQGCVSAGLLSYSESYGVRIVIASSETCDLLPDGEVGEIFVSSPAVALGYWNKPDLDAVFSALQLEGRNFLATGDLGMIVDGRLYVSGRKKELIIINGKNIFPTDLERTLEKELGTTIIRPGCTVAYQHSPTEVGIALEVRNTAMKRNSRCPIMTKDVVATISLAHDVVVGEVFILKQGTVPKTTSGKLRRVETKRLCSSGLWDEASILDSLNSHELSVTDEDRPTLDSLIVKYCGPVTDRDHTWDELGLSSMASVQFRDAIEETFLIPMPVNIFGQYKTPALLEEFISENAGEKLEINLPRLRKVQRGRISWEVMTLLQAVGVVALLFLFSINIIPAWHVGSWLWFDDGKETFNYNERWFRWIWLPFAVPTFLLSLSVSVIMVKWLMIGRYQEQEIQVPSFYYVRWWFVDRAMCMWELFAGRFVKDTVLLWVFYRFLGARIHITAKIDTFLREFDLVEVEEGASIEEKFYNRQFSVWTAYEGPTLRFRRVTVKKHATVRGMLRPGSFVGDDAFVDKLSVVPPGAIVPSGSVVQGNPASKRKSPTKLNINNFSWTVELCKVLWIVFEIYNFFALLLIAQLVFADRLPEGWRYTKLMYWYLYIATTSIFLFAETIVIKWLLIGKRNPGPIGTSVWRKAALWAADWHFEKTPWVLASVCRHHPLFWCCFYKLMGMDIDFQSKILPSSVKPSTADLVKVRKSVVSQVTFDLEKSGQLHETALIESSMGLGSHVDAGTCVSKKIIPPMTYIRESTFQEQLDDRATLLSTGEIIQKNVVVSMLYGLMFGVVFGSLIPTYELWMEVIRPEPINEAVPVLALSLAIQTLVWSFIPPSLEWAANGRPPRAERVKAQPVFVVYQTFTGAFETLSFLWTCQGTPFFNVMAQFMGSKVEGRLLHFGGMTDDWSFITYADRTIIDSAGLAGHAAVYEEVEKGPTRVSGVIYPGSWVTVGADINSAETDPMRVVFQMGKISQDSIRKGDLEMALEDEANSA